MAEALKRISCMQAKVTEAAAALRHRIQSLPKIGIVLGSGLGRLVDGFQEPIRVRYKDIPHFQVSTIAGHMGEVVCGRLSGVHLLALAGRVHYYEGYSMQQIVFPIRVMAALDVTTIIITNAAGAVNESFKPGDTVAICDHINLMGDNPLSGAGNSVDLTQAYNLDLRSLAKKVADRLGITLPSGVYAALSGPAYETPAEIRALRSMGADMVGMSTVPEVIMANSLGIKAFGLSMITNMAAGVSETPLSHDSVIAATKNASPKFTALVKGIIGELDG
jgi:purine-nucleoside phosphorylase